MSDIPAQLRSELSFIRRTAESRTQAARDNLVFSYDQWFAKRLSNRQAELRGINVKMRQLAIAVPLLALTAIGSGILTMGLAPLCLVSIFASSGLAALSALAFNERRVDRKEVAQKVQQTERKRFDLIPKFALTTTPSTYQRWGLGVSDIGAHGKDALFASAFAASKKITSDNLSVHNAAEGFRDEVIAAALATIGAFRFAGVSMPGHFPAPLRKLQGATYQDAKASLRQLWDAGQDMTAIKDEMLEALRQSTTPRQVQPPTTSRDLGVGLI